MEKIYVKVFKSFQKMINYNCCHNGSVDKCVSLLCLQVEKLRSSFAKTLKENETFAQYYARLENKVFIIHNVL